MTIIECRPGRPLGYSTFDDLLPEGVAVVAIGRDSVTFDADLEPEVIASIHDRMTSRDDADQADRAVLRAKRDAVLGDDPVAEAVRAGINYQLGETT